MALGEFELIARYFDRASPRGDVLLGVGDDAALLEVPAGQALVAATDTLVEGRHFLPGTDPDSVGHQALAVNLSDLAAMGATPAWSLLSLSLPAADEAWLEGFARGFHRLAGRYGVALVGGDTVRGPLVITVEVLGFVETALALRRRGARPGDLLFVSGWPGEAAAGLRQLLAPGSGSVDPALLRRLRYAEPRIELGRGLRGVATAAMDVSDGLLGDLARLCSASGVGAVVELDSLPLSPALKAAFALGDCERLVLQGGDDYELLFCVPAARSEAVAALATPSCPLTCIGRIETGAGVRGLRHGLEVPIAEGGYDHFRPAP